MFMKRKMVLLLLCLTIILSMTVSGCNTAATTASSTQSTTKATTAVATTTAAEIVKLTVLCKDYRFEAHKIANRDEYPAWQKCKEDLANLGIELEFETVTPEQLELTVQTRFAAGGDLPDIINGETVDDPTALGYGKQGLVIDIVDAIEQYDTDNSIFGFWDEYFPMARALLTTEDGAIYWFPYLYLLTDIKDDPSFEYISTGFVNSIRKDWMDSLSIEYKQTVTLTELYNTLKAFRDQDANGNGADDEVISIGIDNFFNGIAQAFGLPGALVRVVTPENEVQCPWYKPGIKEYIKYMQKLVQDEMYDTSIMASGAASQMMAENRVGLIMSYICQTWEEPQTGVAEAEYAPILIDNELDNIDPILLREANRGVASKWFISSGCERVDKAIDLFKYVYTHDYYVLNSFGIEGVSYTVDAKGFMVVNYEGGEKSTDPTYRNLPLGFIVSFNALPPLHLGETSIETVKNFTPVKTKNDMEVYVQTWPYSSDSNEQPLAMSTSAEAETINRLSNILDTYSKELLVDLILGNKSLDDFDTYLNEMKELGLDEYIAVFQARYDRFKSVMK